MFDGATSHPANGAAHTAVTTGDFNADGKLDAVVTDADTGTVSVMLGNGDGTLRFAGAFATGSSPSAVAVGDINGDGRPDLAATNGGSNTVSVLLNDGNWGGRSPAAPPPPLMRIGLTTVHRAERGRSERALHRDPLARSNQPVTFIMSRPTARGRRRRLPGPRRHPDLRVRRDRQDARRPRGRRPAR